MAIHNVSRTIDGVTYTIETGKLAKQASGAVTVQAGGTIVLVTAVIADEIREGLDFLPLMIDYREQFYAAGKIPGGFFKRESKPDDRQTLVSRLTDRPIRPLIPKGIYNEIVVTALVISSDGIHQADVLAMNGASAAISISKIPFNGPIGGVRVGRIDGKWVTNPNLEQLPESDINLLVAATKDAISMVEAGANELSEDEIIEGLEYGRKMTGEFVSMIDELVAMVRPVKMAVPEKPRNEALDAEVRAAATETIRKAVTDANKITREANTKAAKDAVVAGYKAKHAGQPNEGKIVTEVKSILEDIEVEIVRGGIIERGDRPDGRRPDELRAIWCEVGVLPGAHGSALFQRGQTQSLGVTTLGTGRDKRRRDDLESEEEESFLFHYNFPPFSVGEAKAIRGTGRREVGHGALAGRALEPLIPSEEDFPYMIRVVSDILESNGSSSMASVCAGSLSLMDAGVPMKSAAAGIAMGLITDDKGRYAILTDIQGLEDHFGDMDFKVAGTREGITSLQMDIKISGLTIEIMREALAQAKKARFEILDIMDRSLSTPRSELAENAPRLVTIKVPEAKIKDIIGPGGKMIRRIQTESGAQLDMADDGTLTIAAWDNESAARAQQMVEQLTATAIVGTVYEGKVVRLMTFGAFVEFLPGQDGLVHISQLDVGRVESVEAAVSIGDLIKVKVTEIDSMGRINLSRKAVLLEEQGLSPEEIAERLEADKAERGPRGGGRDRGDRGGGGGRYARGGDRDRGGRGGDRDRGRGGRGGDRDRGGSDRGGDRNRGRGEDRPRWD